MIAKSFFDIYEHNQESPLNFQWEICHMEELMKAKQHLCKGKLITVNKPSGSQMIMHYVLTYTNLISIRVKMEKGSVFMLPLRNPRVYKVDDFKLYYLYES